MTGYLLDALLQLPYGGRLPGIRTIMNRTGTGQITVSHALEILQKDGLIAMLAALVFFGMGKKTSSGGNWKLPAFGSFLMTGLSQMLSNLPSYFSEAQAVSSIWRTAAFSVGLGLGAVILELPKGKQFFTELGDHFRRLAV